MKTEKQLQGMAGEDLATNLLLQKGYRILERNWHCGHLEVIFGAPEVFVDMQKQRHLIRAAMYYAKFKSVKKEIRFDIVSVINSPEMQEVTHIENAFKPKW